MYQRLVLAHPARVLVVMLAVLGFFAWQARHFELDASADSLLLEADRDLQTLRELQARYASKDLLIVTFAPGGDVFDPASLSRLGLLRDRLRGAPGVESVTSILDVPTARQRGRCFARRGRRQHPHPGRFRSGPRPRQGGADRESGVRGGHREPRRPDRRAPAHDEGRRGVPRPAREAKPVADRAIRGGARRRGACRGRCRDGRHRAFLRVREAPRHREPTRRNRRHPQRARGVRERRHPAPRRCADGRGRHDHLRAQ